MKRSELVRELERVPEFPRPDPRSEQVVTPAEAAADLLEEAKGRGDLLGRSLVDLGTGTGRLAIGAALLGAARVIGIEQDRSALDIARAAGCRLGVEVEWIAGAVGEVDIEVDTVVMNPPFGAQSRGADRPFWTAALGRPGRAVYAFASVESRTFIEAVAVERAARIEARRPVPWRLPRTFAHHRRPSVELAVDLWVLRTEAERT